MFPPQLSGALSAFGNLATDVFQQFGPELMGFMRDQTPQQVSGPTGLEDAAYQTQYGLLGSQGSPYWSQAGGMYNAIGANPGADLSGISGWGLQGGGQYAPGGGQAQPNMFSQQPQAQGKLAANQSFDTSGWREGGSGEANVGEPGRGSGGGFSRTDLGLSDPTGDGGFQATINPQGTGASAISPNQIQPGGPGNVPWNQQSPYSMGNLQGPGSGTVREVVDYNYNTMDRGATKSGFGGGGGGGGAAGGGFEELDRIGNPLETIDFAKHPALASALKTFAATALPGIENSMIGAGLGRSGAAGNAIATGKAQMALPVMQQLIEGELTNKGMDVTQRGQDYQAQIAAQNAAASAAAAGAGADAQRYAAQLAHEAAMRGQDIALRGQDIGLREMDINALLSNAQLRNNSLLGAAGGLGQLGQMDLDRINSAVGGAMDIGGVYRGIQDRGYESEFAAANRPYERIMDFTQPLMGQFGTPGTRTSTTTSGGGGK
jgi:hypothetical protein